MSDKSKEMCHGCRDDFYNSDVPGGCWAYAKAEIVTRFKIGWWTDPMAQHAYEKVETLSCHHAPGKYAMKVEPANINGFRGSVKP